MAQIAIIAGVIAVLPAVTNGKNGVKRIKDYTLQTNKKSKVKFEQ